MRWWERLIGLPERHQISVDPHDMAEACSEREEAERKLAETRGMNSEVRKVSEDVRRLRQANHFSAGIAAAFRRLNG